MTCIRDVKLGLAVVSWMCAMASPNATPQEIRRADGLVLKTESFDREPGWLGVNNRIAQEREPIAIRQDFGFSANSIVCTSWMARRSIVLGS